MRLKIVLFFALIGFAVTSAADAAYICKKYYTSCNSGIPPINGMCCIASVDANDKCYIQSGTSIRDNVGTITFNANLFEGK